MPAVLIEVGFISNNEEAKKLNTEEYQNIICEAIVKGVQDYQSIYPRG